MTDAFERAAQRTEAEHQRRRRERSTRRHRKALRIHATVFVAVQALQWQLGGTSHPWFLYPLLGWGVGLAAHYAATRDGS